MRKETVNNRMGLALFALTLAASSANAQTYNVTVIQPQPGHSSVSANAINNLGAVVGVSYGSPINNQMPYLFTPGLGAQPLPSPPGYAFSVPTDINDAGVIVGYAQTTWSNEGHPIGQLPPAPNVTFILTPVGGLLAGDIDGDGDVGLTDGELFIGVLVGSNVNAEQVARSDVNGNGAANGSDIRPFVAALIQG